MRTIVIGDVHGCLDQLDQLIREVEYKHGQDRLVFLGDLVDKGPDPVGVVRRVRELDALCVMGNHDEKHVRWRKYERRLAATGEANPMRSFDEKRAAEHALLSDEDIDWLANLPTLLRLDEHTIAVHGGLEPKFGLDQQDPKRLLRCRYVNAEGEMVPIFNDVDQPDASWRWAEVSQEPVHVFYGHHCLALGQVRMDSYRDADGLTWFRCGADAGCAYGGALAAAISTDEMRLPKSPKLVFHYVQGLPYVEPWMGDE